MDQKIMKKLRYSIPLKKRAVKRKMNGDVMNVVRALELKEDYIFMKEKSR